MSMLYIKCPKTGKNVPTGISVPKNSDLSGFTKNSISCPHCGEIHMWDGKHAFHL